DVQSASQKIPRLKVEYQLARPIFVRVVSQYTEVRRAELRDPRTGQILSIAGANGTTVQSVSTRSDALRTDWLFSYRPTPGTVAFVGYGSTEEDPLGERNLRRTNDSFFFKLSYVFRAKL